MWDMRENNTCREVSLDVRQADEAGVVLEARVNDHPVSCSCD